MKKFKVKAVREILDDSYNSNSQYETVYDVYYGKKYLDSFTDNPKRLIKKFNKIIKGRH